MLAPGRRIKGTVVLITGATSGIGRASAHRFSEEGADLVLAARSSGDLDAVAAECERSGARVLTVQTDVGDEDDVRALASAGAERFGRIDTWINNAGVIAYGDFEEMPSDVFDKVIRTNLLGQVYGARAALAQFRRQGGGTLVNLSSVWARVTSPYVVPYVVSKHAARAFSKCLRLGLATGEDAERIHVCTVVPESVDTPIFEHAANYTGREAKPVAPVIGPDRTARAIVSCVRRPRAEIAVGQVGHGVAVGGGLIPRQLFERIAPKLFEMTALNGHPTDDGPGNLFEPTANRLDGGWRRPTGARARRGAVVAAATAAMAAGGLIARRARHK